MFWFFVFVSLIAMTNHYTIIERLIDINSPFFLNDLFLRYFWVIFWAAVLFYFIPSIYWKISKNFSYDDYKDSFENVNFWLLVNIYFILWVLWSFVTSNENHTFLIILFSFIIVIILNILINNNFNIKKFLIWFLFVEILLFILYLVFNNISLPLTLTMTVIIAPLIIIIPSVLWYYTWKFLYKKWYIKCLKIISYSSLFFWVLPIIWYFTTLCWINYWKLDKNKKILIMSIILLIITIIMSITGVLLELWASWYGI